MKPDDIDNALVSLTEAQLYQEREIQRTEQIKSTHDFDSLYEVLKSIGVIRGSSTTYTPEKIINYIDSIRGGALVNLKLITRTYGLRDKVEELVATQTDGR